MEVHRGEVFYADLSPVVGSEQGGVRPVLIVQNEIGQHGSKRLWVSEFTLFLCANCDHFFIFQLNFF